MRYSALARPCEQPALAVHLCSATNCCAAQVGKQSKAAMSMCLWVLAMDTYATVYRVVEPKRQALAAAEAALGTSNAQLAAKQEQLATIEAQVSELRRGLEDTQAELSSLQAQVGLKGSLRYAAHKYAAE